MNVDLLPSTLVEITSVEIFMEVNLVPSLRPSKLGSFVELIYFHASGWVFPSK